MGKSLFQSNFTFRKTMTQLNDIIKNKSGISIIDNLYDTTKNFTDTFDDLSVTHPAIFMVEYSLAMVLMEMGIEPDYVWGSSLGEFTGAAVAGIMDIDEIVDAIVQQAVILKKNCKQGGMLAILSNPTVYENEACLRENSDLVSINYNSHFIISGKTAGLDKIKSFLRKRGIIFWQLPVTLGFHSSAIDPAYDEYINYLHNLTFSKPKIPIISSSNNCILQDVSQFYFWDVIRKPILFREILCHLSKNINYSYLDLGPSGTLAKFVKFNFGTNNNSLCFAIMTPFQQEMAKIEKTRFFIEKGKHQITNIRRKNESVYSC